MRLEIGKYFDVHLSSEEVGVKKPDRMMFHQVSRSLEVPTNGSSTLETTLLTMCKEQWKQVYRQSGSTALRTHGLWIQQIHEIRDLSELIEFLSEEFL